MGYMILELPICNARVVFLNTSSGYRKENYRLLAKGENHIIQFLNMDRPCHIIKLHVGNMASNRKILQVLASNMWDK
jgi:hypothetical protein